MQPSMGIKKYVLLGVESEGVCVPSFGLLNPFWQFRPHRAESWDLRGAAEPAPQNLFKGPFTS